MERTSEVVYFVILGKLFVLYSMTTAIRSHIVVGPPAIASIARDASHLTLRSVASVLLLFMVALSAPNLSLIFSSARWQIRSLVSHEWLLVTVFGALSAARMLSIQ